MPPKIVAARDLSRHGTRCVRRREVLSCLLSQAGQRRIYCAGFRTSTNLFPTCSSTLNTFHQHFGATFAKGVKRRPQTGNSEHQEYNRNIKTPVSIFLLHSYYILGLPCRGVPISLPLIWGPRGLWRWPTKHMEFQKNSPRQLESFS